MNYSKTVEAIKDLPWESFDPYQIVYISFVTALEFGGSLKSALEEYPESEALKEMASGELDTDNLSFGSYANKKGDHVDFIDHFMRQRPFTSRLDLSKRISKSSRAYVDMVSNLSKKERAMTIFSREQELPGIFEKILVSHDWNKHDLGFYEYYLRRHIELDSAEGGHADLTKGFEMDSDVLGKFYEARLELYKALAPAA